MMIQDKLWLKKVDPVYKNKRDTQSYSNCRGNKLLNHTTNFRIGDRD